MYVEYVRHTSKITHHTVVKLSANDTIYEEDFLLRFESQSKSTVVMEEKSRKKC